MGSTSKRAATTAVRYTFSDEDEQDVAGGTVKSGGKKKKAAKLKTVVCKLCHKKYTDREGLRRHMELHTDELHYACDDCDARFKTAQYLGRHRKRVHSPPTHECEFCGKRFTMPSKLEQHRYVHTGEKPHKCEVCGKAFRAPYSLNTHRFTHTNEKPFKCRYCPYACRDSSTLRKHHARHTGTLKWHHCAYCDKKYYAKSMLKSHVSEVHFAVDLRVIPCAQCDLKFKTNSQLNSHVKVVHERALRAACEVCGVEISNKHNMAAHLRAHLRVRPYKCDFKSCQKRFKDVSTLRKHALIHKPDEQHACEVCGKLFARRHRLNVHMRRHGDDTKTSFKVMFCDYCGFSYDNKQRLIRHIQKHIRHRNTYVCDVCKYVTHRKLSIEKHMKYGHGDEDDRYCKICDKSYKLHAYLILHYYNRHGVRYKTVRNIKLETSVTIKEEPHEPVPDAEVDLEEIQKQEPLADIITDVALDCEATDISYSRAVLSEDIERSVRSALHTTTNTFRRRLGGRAALIREQKTLYARKEMDVKKKISKLLSRVRHKKWARAIERARREYNRRIRASAARGTDNSKKIKFVNLHQDKDNKKVKTDQNDNKNDAFENNTGNIETWRLNDMKLKITDREGHESKRNCKIDTETNNAIVINNEDLARENIVEKGGPYVYRKAIERDEDNLTNDDTDTMESFVNDNAINGEGVRNIYEDVFDIEENPIGDMNEEDIAAVVNDKETNKRTDDFDKISVDIDSKNDNVNDTQDKINYSSNKNANIQRNSPITNNLDYISVNRGSQYKNVSDKQGKIGDSKDKNENIQITNSESDHLDKISVNRVSEYENVDSQEKIDDMIDKNENSEMNNSKTNNLDTISVNKDSEDKNIDDSQGKIDSKDENAKMHNIKHNSIENTIDVSNLNSKVSEEGNVTLDMTEDDEDYIYNLSLCLRRKKKDNTKRNNKVSKENGDFKKRSNENSENIINCEKGDKGGSVKLKINIHQCYVCHKLYETEKKLLDHCQEHFDVCTDIPLKKCPLCNYVTKQTITQHLKLVHDVKINLLHQKLHDKNKYTEKASRYCYNINDKIVKEIEIIPSVRNLNKIAYVEIDKKNRMTKDLAVAKTKLVKKSGEWVVEHENMDVNNEFLLPKFDKKEIKRLKHVGDSYLDVIKVLGRLATRHKAKMLYPCNGCEKLCQTFSALKLHSRRHESNPKPFKKKVWKHKLKNQLKPVQTRYSRVKPVNNHVRQSKPKPIENKHKCDNKLMEFYEQNVKGADIEFWQFLKIYNRMNREHKNLEKLTETNEFGDYTEINDEVATTHNNLEKTQDNASQKDLVTSRNDKIMLNKSKVSNKFVRRMVLSKEEKLRRERIKEQLRNKISGVNKV